MIQLDKLTEALLKKLPQTYRDYAEIALEETARLLFMVFGTVALNLIVLFFFKALWKVYAGTFIGKQFIEKEPDLYLSIAQLLDQGLLSTSMHLTSSAMLICLAIALLAQFSYLRHLLYSSQNFMIKGIWVLAACWLIAEHVQSDTAYPLWTFGYLISLPSAIALTGSSMTLAGNTLPEAGTMVLSVYNRIRDRL